MLLDMRPFYVQYAGSVEVQIKMLNQQLIPPPPPPPPCSCQLLPGFKLKFINPINRLMILA